MKHNLTDMLISPSNAINTNNTSGSARNTFTSIASNIARWLVGSWCDYNGNLNQNVDLGCTNICDRITGDEGKEYTLKYVTLLATEGNKTQGYIKKLCSKYEIFIDTKKSTFYQCIDNKITGDSAEIFAAGQQQGMCEASVAMTSLIVGGVGIVSAAYLAYRCYQSKHRNKTHESIAQSSDIELAKTTYGNSDCVVHSPMVEQKSRGLTSDKQMAETELNDKLLPGQNSNAKSGQNIVGKTSQILEKTKREVAIGVGLRNRMEPDTQISEAELEKNYLLSVQNQ